MTVKELREQLGWCNQEAEAKLVVGLIAYPIFRVDPDGKFITREGEEKAVVLIESR
jgi:hypothetical protein